MFSPWSNSRKSILSPQYQHSRKANANIRVQTTLVLMALQSRFYYSKGYLYRFLVSLKNTKLSSIDIASFFKICLAVGDEGIFNARLDATK